MQERVHFISNYRSGLHSMTELCERFGVSRKSDYKWICRYRDLRVVARRASSARGVLG